MWSEPSLEFMIARNSRVDPNQKLLTYEKYIWARNPKKVIYSLHMVMDGGKSK